MTPEATPETEAGPTARGSPRPQLRRSGWWPLDGTWQFALDPAAAHRVPDDVQWEREICVPFSPETRRSGVCETILFHACWYRRSFERPAMGPGERMLLHFGAGDYDATVWVNGSDVSMPPAPPSRPEGARVEAGPSEEQAGTES